MKDHPSTRHQGEPVSTETAASIVEKATEVAEDMLPDVADEGRRRWLLALLGLGLAAGAAVVAKVLVARRRAAQETVEWPTYEPPGVREPEPAAAAAAAPSEAEAPLVADITDKAVAPSAEETPAS